MSRAEGPDRLLDAAVRLGVTRGAGALTIQGIATAAGVSKANVLYHFGDKAALVARLTERLATTACARMGAAASTSGALEAWRALAAAELERGELALLAALAQDGEAHAEVAARARSTRDEAGARLGAALMRSLGLEPRMPLAYLGRVLVRHLDGLAVAAATQPFSASELEAELDAFAIALLGMGR